MGLDRKHRARLNGLPIEQNGARTADRSFTDYVSAGACEQIVQVAVLLSIASRASPASTS
jgi:hypothetical protein